MKNLQQLFTPHQRVSLATGVIVLAALISVRFPLKSQAQFQEGPGNSRFIVDMARFVPLRNHIPRDDRVGYLAGPGSHSAADAIDRGGRTIAQYVLLPHIVERSTYRQFIIFDSTDPAAYPAQARDENWALVTDLGNGVKLFRKSKGW